MAPVTVKPRETRRAEARSLPPAPMALAIEVMPKRCVAWRWALPKIVTAERMIHEATMSISTPLESWRREVIKGVKAMRRRAVMPAT